MTIFHLLRPKDWVKNLTVFGAVIFTGGLQDPVVVIKAVFAFIFFCLLASSGYVFNDWQDRDRDRLHPVKSLRPLASELVTPSQALVAGAWLAGAGMVGLYLLGPGPVIAGGAYLVMSMGYTVFFKHQPGMDAIVVMVLYLLRVEAGAQVVGVHAPFFLLLCTGAVTLPIALAKRQSDRQNDPFYESLQGAHWAYAGLFCLAFVFYAVYSFSPSVLALSGQTGLLISVPFAAWGLTVLYQGHVAGQLDDPVKFFFGSVPLQVAGMGWLVTCLLGLYGPL